MLSLLWSASFWLPANSSWDALKSGESVSYPQADDLKYSVYFGVVLILVRLIWESLILIPLGHVLGISHSKKTLAEQIRIHAQYTFFASEKSKRKRVLECFWLLLMYTFLSAFGWYVTWNKPWLTEVTACWKDWPRHPITAD
uniref:Uncharacterized protein n=1 Tax=Plectus sambesii TaxID=2011161 RepID=A0A914VEZ7_9BILA